MGFSPEQAKNIDKIIRAYGDWTSNDDAGLNTLTIDGKKINVVGGFTGGAGKDYRKQLFLVDRYRQNTTPTVPINRHGGTIKAQAGAKVVNVAEVDDPSKA